MIGVTGMTTSGNTSVGMLEVVVVDCGPGGAMVVVVVVVVGGGISSKPTQMMSSEFGVESVAK
jgi:hypothetical protein